jgi:hypothetical protein
MKYILKQLYNIQKMSYLVVFVFGGVEGRKSFRHCKILSTAEPIEERSTGMEMWGRELRG